MAFCTSCGANLEPTTRFCTKCGTANPSVAAMPATGAQARPAQPGAATPAPQATSSSALKIILIVFAVIVVLGVISVVGMLIAARMFIHRTRVEQRGNHARVETPFGTVESSADAGDIAKNLGVDVYPGAKGLPGGSAVSFGNFKSATAEFETDDSPDKVVEFYKSRFPRSNVSVNDQGGQTLVFMGSKGMTTIVIEPRSDKTHIQIAQVSGVNSSGQPEPK
jgi:hypothetical protein